VRLAIARSDEPLANEDATIYKQTVSVIIFNYSSPDRITGKPITRRKKKMPSENIIIRGARQHNLKNVNLVLPQHQLIAVTGLSGSGKSTLAFDTLYAEGQRRYVESLSTYARQFLERLEKPDVDLIEGLSPAIAIEQKSTSHNPRSTVGTVTEIYDYLRLLFARVGIPHCHQCGLPVTSHALDEVVDRIMGMPPKTRLIILAPLVANAAGNHGTLVNRLKRDGFARLRINGEILDIDSVTRLNPRKKYTIDVVVDRLAVKQTIRNRLADSLELALAQSEGQAIIEASGERLPPELATIVFSERSLCTACGIGYDEFTPAHFSFNSPHGACPHCGGLGTVMEIDPDLIVPNPELSLREGAVDPWAKRNTVQFAEFLDALTGHFGVDVYTPFAKLPETFRHVLLHGSGDEKIRFYSESASRRYTYEKSFEGLLPQLQRRYQETDSYLVREDIKRYMNFRSCSHCSGGRLNPASLAVKVGNRPIHEICALSISEARHFFAQLKLPGKAALIADKILKEIDDRLSFLENVGLSYLALDRTAATLSGGESQRIRLATQIGSKLTGVLYVLDEPSVGLHQRDNRRLLQTLLRMRDLGNTVLIVEHDEETIRASNCVVDMGPGAGVNGGEIVFSGTPQDLTEDPHSLTGLFMSGRRRIPVPGHRRSGSGKDLLLKGAAANNLKQIDVRFPLGCLICVTGVSGSGKSTLVLETLHRALSRKLYQARVTAGDYRSLRGLRHIDKVVHIDQAPIGRTPRSNPGTYTGLFTHIRDLFSKTPEARSRGYRAGRFSFNVKGGRCEACRGDGVIKIEMHFLPDAYVTCDVCQGRRYNRETLEVRYKGKNITEVLNMTVNQTAEFFRNVHVLREKLETIISVGLGYIRIGQPATTLSGGEAQRVKLAKELSKRSTGRTVYILDEPTTGLHPYDIQKLMEVLNRFVDAGNTVIIIEHNMDVIKTADHIIDLGPEGGDAGGAVVVSGSPEAVAQCKASHTGRYLGDYLSR
jgi:excinuclease ABC subunit A